MKIGHECINPARRFVMRDNEVQIRILAGENAETIAKAFKEYYHADLVEVRDEYGMRVLAVA